MLYGGPEGRVIQSRKTCCSVLKDMVVYSLEGRVVLKDMMVYNPEGQVVLKDMVVYNPEGQVVLSEGHGGVQS